MNNEELKMLDAIMKKTGGKLPYEEVKKIAEDYNLQEGEELPEIIVTDDYFEFEEETRNREDIYEDDWGEVVKKEKTAVYLGDYEPGSEQNHKVDKINERKEEKKERIADFSINQRQAVVKIADINGKHKETIHIYLPNKIEETQDTSFKRNWIRRNRNQSFKKIKDIVGGALDNKQINEIIDRYKYGRIPELVGIKDPIKFEEETKKKETRFSHSWAGDAIESVDSETLIGDYQIGLLHSYEYSENGDTPKGNYQNKDGNFQINQLQIVHVNRSVSDHYNGNDIDESDEKIVIYTPEERKELEGISFNEFKTKTNKKDSFNRIKAAVGDKLSEEQIIAIIDGYEDGVVPRIEVTSNPYQFEQRTRRTDVTFEDVANGEYGSKIKVLTGDYQPGVNSEDKNEEANFSTDKLQIAQVSSDYAGVQGMEKYNKIIYVYIPEERECQKGVSFKEMLKERNKKESFDRIKKAVGDKLSEEQILGIISKYENGIVPAISVTGDVYEFERKTRQITESYSDGYMGSRSSKHTSTVIVGDYQPGLNYRKEKAYNGRMVEEAKTADEQADFSMNNIQVVQVKQQSYNYLGYNHEENDEEYIYIYLPEEREYPDDASFKKMMERELLKRKKNELTSLEKEAEKIKEVERLIEQKEENERE